MRLPHADRAFIDLTKITGYLLSATHRDGHSKARALTAVLSRVRPVARSVFELSGSSGLVKIIRGS